MSTLSDRDAQAEKILKEALRSQISRNTAIGFVCVWDLGQRVVRPTRNEGEDWQQTAALGLNVDLANPLYGNGKLVEPGDRQSRFNCCSYPADEWSGFEFVDCVYPDASGRSARNGPNRTAAVAGVADRQ